METYEKWQIYLIFWCLHGNSKQANRSLSIVWVTIAYCLYCRTALAWATCHFFPLCELSHFLTSVYRQGVPCERNSSYNFIPIFLKLRTCFFHLKICMWFGYNPCFNFYHFFHFANFVISWPQILWKCIDSGYLVSTTPHSILYRSFWNFAHVFAMVCRYACGWI